MDLIERLRKVDTCAVSDALDTLRLPGAVTGVHALWPVQDVVVGRVRTIRVAPRAEGVPGHHIATQLVASAREGDVVVIDNRGRVDVSCWGGILTVAALQKGIAGVIIDGACRDIAESHALGLPVFGKAVVPVTARGRIVQEAMDIPVSVGTVVVSSDDYVIADRSGIAFIRVDVAERVVNLAERIVAREQEMAEAVRSGQSVVEVMHDARFPTADEAK